jgi:predicted aspartyl protease
VIYGVVTNNQATIPKSLRGADGAEITVDGFLDTGFSRYLILHPTLIGEMCWQRVGERQVEFANGERRWLQVYNGRVYWNDNWRKVEVMAAESEPLIGMALLAGHNVNMDVIADGRIIIEPIDE